MRQTRTRPNLRFALAALTLAAALLPSRAADDCKATVSSQLKRKSPKELVTTYSFQVDVTTEEACAEVGFTLFTTEQLPSGESKVFETPGTVRLRGGSTTQKLTYDLKKENQLVEWKIKQTSCTRCEP